jgi:DNA-3-methyladenine glycosylase
MSFKPLPRSFYAPSARVVAPRLLGQVLVRNTPKGSLTAVITETEAYLANDPACHGARGLTPRNRVMFGQAGYAYVYFIYGCHFCLNAVCRPAGIAEAVLLRALHPLDGEHLMRSARPVKELVSITNGPGKLCQALGIDRELNGVDLCAQDSPLFIAENPSVASFIKQFGPPRRGVRVGISLAKEMPLRFWLGGSPFVSKGGA